jgi:hypothetical protein
MYRPMKQPHSLELQQAWPIQHFPIVGQVLLVSILILWSNIAQNLWLLHLRFVHWHLNCGYKRVLI